MIVGMARTYPVQKVMDVIVCDGVVDAAAVALRGHRAVIFHRAQRGGSSCDAHLCDLCKLGYSELVLASMVNRSKQCQPGLVPEDLENPGPTGEIY